MKVLLLGYGKEGQSAKRFFEKQNAKVEILDHFERPELEKRNYNEYDLVLRSPSVQPWLAELPHQLPAPNWSSVTQYFFQHCPCPIIGVTGTKGKGTTCMLITELLTALGQKTWLVGNIGTPALDKLERIEPKDIVVYEMSSFQLWDLQQSPQIAVVLKVEPDHLNIHHSFDDYTDAKANIIKYQKAEDSCIYCQSNSVSKSIAMQSMGKKIAYPIVDQNPMLKSALDALAIRGEHNRENAEAALLTVAAARKEQLNQLLKNNIDVIKNILHNFKGLPHRLQYLRQLNNVEYYDDNFATTLASTTVALEAFREDEPIVIIVGGRDKTQGKELPKLAELLDNQKNIEHIILIGESGAELNKKIVKKPKELVADLATAVKKAQNIAEELAKDSGHTVSVLMSPAAASFDMFENVYDRGTRFQDLINQLN